MLHAFQKKSKKGKETPKEEMEIVKRRLKIAEQEHKEWLKKVKKKKRKKQTYEDKLADTRVEIGSGNVFADLSFANSEEMLATAQLVSEIHKAIKKKKLTQTEGAKIRYFCDP